jgi:hypothetical protein
MSRLTKAEVRYGGTAVVARDDEEGESVAVTDDERGWCDRGDGVREAAGPDTRRTVTISPCWYQGNSHAHGPFVSTAKQSNAPRGKRTACLSRNGR